MSRENERERERESKDDGRDMRISQKLFLDRKSVSRDRVRLLRMTSYELSGIV